MKTITLDIEMNFIEAIQYLLDGKCIGIKPGKNTKFLVRYFHKGTPQHITNYELCWDRTVKDNLGEQGVRTEQYLGKWYPVIIDHNDLPENTKQKFILQNITNL